MSCIAEFTIRSLDLPLMGAFERAPEMRLDVEQTITTESGRPVLFVWADGGDFDAFEAGLDDDETVVDPTLMESLPEQRLYRLFVADDADTTVFPTDAEVGASRLDASFTVDGLHTRMRFPDRDALRCYRQRCAERDVEMSVHRIYRGDTTDQNGYGLSPKQRQVLSLAAKRGYFEVPREVSLTELADELDISAQSTSERLRRGVDQLVSATLAPESNLDTGPDSPSRRDGE
ncbi:helix-turn-helix domain-containing protein [Haloferax larsenii]|uniref:GAF and HTH_10 associated domain-containing protein n=1 Tax=Haloferax larsenii TaxID=302484 RepID=A0A1H7HFJ3_HALLR|nr:helix-turn-helix domain-containing protein [Haloferax larsenii]SEK48477.1 GAF and HTH_10 associated domain-containing protein [Haloferax larsenii]